MQFASKVKSKIFQMNIVIGKMSSAGFLYIYKSSHAQNQIKLCFIYSEINFFNTAVIKT